MYIQFSNDEDIAMRYEGLACAAFNCKRYGGPDNLAIQSFYNENFVPEPNFKAIWALEQIITQLVKKANGENKAHLRNIFDSLDERLKQESSADLIDYLIKICKEELPD